jgi:hypothetical protein
VNFYLNKITINFAASSLLNFQDELAQVKGGDYIALVQVLGIEFDLLVESKQQQEIAALAQILKMTVTKLSFFKMNLPFEFANQITFLDSLSKYNDKHISLYKKELKTRQFTGKEENCYFLAFSGKSQKLLLEDVKRCLQLDTTLELKSCSKQLLKLVLEKVFFLVNKGSLKPTKQITLYPSFFKVDNTFTRILTITKLPLSVEGG